MPIIMRGKEVAEKILENIKQEVKQLDKKPSLTVIIVGSNPASQLYVKKKKETAEKIGFISNLIELDESITQQELEANIDKLNDDNNTNAILVQLPLPKHLNSEKIIEKINPKKDVDGFHPINIGKLLLGLNPYSIACTPLGIIKMLEYYNIQVEGKNAVIIGRSNIVGKPLAALLIQKNATVTVCHSRTKNLAEIAYSADILISAIGKPKFIDKTFIKEGAVVIDVGINRLPDGKLTGDVNFEDAKELSSYITPVPGGVGPMTIATLLSNTLELYKLQRGEE